MEKENITDNSDLLKRIGNLIEQARTHLLNEVNATMTYTYFEIGRAIVEDEQNGNYRSAYGTKVLEKLSEKLTLEFGKGFSKRNLEQMRKFYITYHSLLTNEKTQTLSSQFVLSWSHYLFLMNIDDLNERNFYETEAANQHWSLRELKRQFNSALYERLALSKDKDAVTEMSKQGIIVEKPEDIVKDPYILEFLGLPENKSYSESKLEQSIIDKLQDFLLEMGKGYTFVGRQVRLTLDEKHFYVDLVFFNRLLQCFVLIDLKIGEISHQDLGQMQMYVNYYDRRVKLPNENPTIGIVLCKKKDDTLVELTLPDNNTQIFASKYQTVLPNKEELRRLLDEHLSQE